MRIFSGIQPTGRKHLGNYIGAIAQYVSSQERGEGIFCIVDLHAITVAYDPLELRERLYDTTAILLAAGLDPQRCILFRQSDVPEHTELTWLLCSVTELGRLQRMHQFRDKSLAQRELVSAGLLLYPVLQAADVLAYRAHEVPVGEDQREHLELMRDVARRFNARFGDGEEVLVVPEHRIPEVGARIMDLQDPTRKMSTTSALRAGHRVRARRAQGDREEAQERRHRLRQRGAPRPREAGRQQPDRNPRRGAGLDPAAIEAELAQARYGELKARRGGRRRSSTSRPCASATSSCAPTRARSRRSSPTAPTRAREIAAQTLADVRERMGVGRARAAATRGTSSASTSSAAGTVRG